MLKTALMLTPILLIAGLAFWFLIPSKQPIIFSQNQETKADNSSEYSNLNDKLNSLEDKVNELESSNSALLSQINTLQSAPKTNNTSPKKSPVLIPINPGGNINSTEWSNLTSGSITINPADYPGYKNAYLIINLSVYVGQGTAYARLVNSQNGLAIIPSAVSTTSYSPVSLTSSSFKLPEGSNQYTIQLYTQVPGYPAQAGDSFLQITY